ncbi:MAG: serine protease [Phenylobacterium sp.]|jgi:serine protease
MKNLSNKNLITIAITSALAIGAVSVQATPVTELAVFKQTAKVQNTRYIVKFKQHAEKSLQAAASKSGQSIAQARKAANVNSLSKHGAQMLVHMDMSNAAAAHLSQAQLKALQNDSAVEYVEVDPIRHLIDTVTRSFDTEAVETLAESNPYGVALVQANQVSDAQTSNMNVCITDTGYDGNHEDLRPYTDSGITGDDNDGLGNDTGDWWVAGHSHGTHVAGTIAALGNNGKGVTSVNPSGLLDLHNIKIFDNSGNWAYGSDLVKAIEQCRTAGSNVISMSIGGGASSQTEENAFIAAANAGVFNIAAAGNDGNSSMSYPASYDSVMSVGALNSSKNIASFSQYNSQVEIAAPGVAVNSTIINNAYASWDGTSMATPHVAGVAALVWSHYPQCSGNQIRQAMVATAEDLGSAGRDNYYGYGLVQAKDMYDALANGCDVTTPPPPPPPVAGVLDNGIPHTGLSGASGSEQNFTMAVPAGATNVSITMSGGTSGDADLYTRFGSAPTTSSYDCRPYVSGNNETCTGTSDNGTYHVMLRAYSTFSGVSLVGSYDDVTTPPPGGGTYSNNTDVNINDRSTVSSAIDVTGNGASGSITVDVDIKHTYVGDLTLTLVAPSGETVTLRQNTGGSSNDISETYNVNSGSIERNGQWTLRVNDNANQDTGYIDSWTINF